MWLRSNQSVTEYSNFLYYTIISSAMLSFLCYTVVVLLARVTWRPLDACQYAYRAAAYDAQHEAKKYKERQSGQV